VFPFIRLGPFLLQLPGLALLAAATLDAPSVTAALRAVREGVRSVHIIDGGVPSALLLEVLTAEGVGTALRSDTGAHFFDDSRAYLLEK